MKTGDVVEIVGDDGEAMQGVVARIVIEIEDKEGELWEVAVDEALVPEFGEGE